MNVEFLGSDDFRLYYIACMALLGFVPLFQALPILNRSPRIMVRILFSPLNILRLFRSTQLSHTELQDIQRIVSRKQDPSITLRELESRNLKSHSPLSRSIRTLLSAIKLTSKNQLLSSGVLPSRHIIQAQLSDSLLSFRYWGAFQAKLGLFGTFLGVSVGLTLMSEKLPKLADPGKAAPGEIQKANRDALPLIKGVISSSATAFHTSVVGLAFALAFSLLDRTCSQWLSAIIEPISKKLDDLAPDWALSEADSLDKAMRDLAEIVNNLKTASIESGQATQQLLTGIVVELDSTFQQLQAQITEAVRASMDIRYSEYLSSVGLLNTNIEELIAHLRESRNRNT